MNDCDKTREQLLEELAAVRQRLTELESQRADVQHPDSGEQAEQLMRLHVEQTPLAVIEWDLQLRVTKWNPSAARIFGYSAAEARGCHFMFIVPPALHEQVDRVWAQLRNGRGGERSTNENTTKDGRTILCEWYNTPLVDAAGEVVGFASLAQDITERVAAETALRQSERRLATIISNLPGAVYRCRADGNWTIEFLSDGYLALTGYPPSELIGQPGARHTELIHPEDRQREFDAMQQAVAQKRHYQVEYRLRTATGEEKWVWEQGIGVFSESGQWEAFEGYTVDITARKRAEEAVRLAHDQLEQKIAERTAALNRANVQLQQESEERRRTLEALCQSEAKYRALIESSPDAVTMLNLQGRLIFASQQAAELHGIADPEELLGRAAAELVTIRDRERFTNALRQLLEEGVRRNIHYKMIGRGGKTFDAEVSSAVIRDAAGNPQALMGIYRDITARKRSEERLQREKRALRRMVMASDHERRLITYDLHDGVAQQLVAAMIQLQSAEPGKSGRPATLEPAAREVLQTLRTAAAELRRLMNRLRTPVLDKFGLAEAIGDVAAQLQATAGTPEIDYHSTVQFQRLEPTLENSVYRIAQEAMTNACKHSRSEIVRVELTQHGNEVTLEVRDWGIGFDPDKVAENRFGLEGIRERARLLGARLLIRSRIGQGTVVRVRFPVIELEPPP